MSPEATRTDDYSCVATNQYPEMKYIALFFLVDAALVGCGHSTQCFDISNDQAVATSYRALDNMLQKSNPSTSGIPATTARELSVSEVERFTGDRGDGLLNVRVTFTKRGNPGRLLAFVYEDCAVEWSPKFRTPPGRKD